MMSKHLDVLSRAYRLFSQKKNKTLIFIDAPRTLDEDRLIDRMHWTQERGFIFFSGLVQRMSGVGMNIVAALPFLKTNYAANTGCDPFVAICVIKLLFPHFFPFSTDMFVRWMRVNLNELSSRKENRAVCVDQQNLELSTLILTVLQGHIYVYDYYMTNLINPF
jgi:hypothetical protein